MSAYHDARRAFLEAAGKETPAARAFAKKWNAQHPDQDQYTIRPGPEKQALVRQIARSQFQHARNTAKEFRGYGWKDHYKAARDRMRSLHPRIRTGKTSYEDPPKDDKEEMTGTMAVGTGPATALGAIPRSNPKAARRKNKRLRGKP